MRTQWMAVRWIAALAMTGLAPLTHAITTGTVAVSATVSPSAVVGFKFSVQPLVITEADIARGYVEVVMQSRMQLKSRQRAAGNQPQFTVDVLPRADLFKSVDVESPSSRESGGRNKVTVAREEVLADGEQLAEFRYRFELAGNVRPGRYDSPISLAIDL